MSLILFLGFLAYIDLKTKQIHSGYLLLFSFLSFLTVGVEFLNQAFVVFCMGFTLLYFISMFYVTVVDLIKKEKKEEYGFIFGEADMVVIAGCLIQFLAFSPLHWVLIFIFCIATFFSFLLFNLYNLTLGGRKRELAFIPFIFFGYFFTFIAEYFYF